MWLFVAAALLAGAVGGGVAVASLLLNAQPSPKKQVEIEAEAQKQEKAKELAERVQYDGFDEIYVNVRSPSLRRFLVVKLSLTLRNQAALERLLKSQKGATHALITMLKAKTLKELGEPDVTTTLSYEARTVLNQILGGENEIIQVFFTRFVVE